MSQGCPHDIVDINQFELVWVCRKCGYDFQGTSEEEIERIAQEHSQRLKRKWEHIKIEFDKALKLTAEISERLGIEEVNRECGLNMLLTVLSGHLIIGRPVEHLALACLFIMCRIKRSAHTLLDFSAASQVNEHDLEQTCLEITSAFNLTLPLNG